MGRVPRHRLRNCSLGALTAALLAITVGVLGDFDASRAGASPRDPAVSASVGSNTTSGPMAQGFVGVSLEYSALHVYTGRDPRAVNPVLIQLLRDLAPGQSPVLRIGGNSADQTWWPIRGMIPPGGVRYALTPGWMRTTSALAQALHAQMIMGLNLAGGRPSLAAAEARAFLAGVGRRYVQAFEIGNEPDVYAMFRWYRDRKGRWFYARGSSWSLDNFIAQFSQWRAAIPHDPLAGPAFAELNWLSGLPQFLQAEPGLRVLTLHRYPLRACISDPTQAGYPTIPALLADLSSAGIAQAVAPYVSTAHDNGVTFRVDKMNSASCSGKRGVSDTFASALWALDTLFNLASVGVDGINVHSFPGAAYELFTFKHARAGWEAFVHPEYYGMLLFAQAFPPGAQMLSTNVSPSGPLKVWATRDPQFTTRVVLINKDPANTYQVTLQVAAFSHSAHVDWLQAPSVDATHGVTLGGQSFGDETTSGYLSGPPQIQTVDPVLGQYTITMPPASAAMLTQ
jgi:hypothetical protein